MYQCTNVPLYWCASAWPSGAQVLRQSLYFGLTASCPPSWTSPNLASPSSLWWSFDHLLWCDLTNRIFTERDCHGFGIKYWESSWRVVCHPDLTPNDIQHSPFRPTHLELELLPSTTISAMQFLLIFCKHWTALLHYVKWVKEASPKITFHVLIIKCVQSFVSKNFLFSEILHTILSLETTLLAT